MSSSSVLGHALRRAAEGDGIDCRDGCAAERPRAAAAAGHRAIAGRTTPEATFRV
ncbi:MAG TPA: hypothetical protein VE959_20685 [Bryobacteraceae bacterium]|nr:hypothetical protein [Bryobacteraceae bacterium]